MFKKLIFAALLGLFLSAPAVADVKKDDLMCQAQPVQMTQAYDCYAYTACPNGGAVACHVWGVSSAGVACSWFVVPYRGVGCDGYDANGYWQSYRFVCP